MTGTGVKASPEELERLQALAKMAAEMPVIFSGLMPPPSPWQRVYEETHKCALAHGLPEIPGFYGVAWNGEFMKA